MAKRNMPVARRRVSLNLHPQIYQRVASVVAKLKAEQLETASAYTMQRYIEESVIRRLVDDWKAI